MINLKCFLALNVNYFKFGCWISTWSTVLSVFYFSKLDQESSACCRKWKLFQVFVSFLDIWFVATSSCSGKSNLSVANLQRTRASDPGLPDAAVQALPSALHGLRVHVCWPVHDRDIPPDLWRHQPGRLQPAARGTDLSDHWYLNLMLVWNYWSTFGWWYNC